MRWLLGLMIAATLTLGSTCAQAVNPAPTQTTEGDNMAFVWTGVGLTPTSAAITGGSSVVYTVPDGVYWEIESLRGFINTSAVAGNRYMQVAFSDGGFVRVKTITWPTAIPASTQGHGDIAAGAAGVSTVVVAGLQFQTVPFTPIFLPAGYAFWLYDGANIDTAADTLALVAQYKEYRYTTPDQVPVQIVGSVQVTP